MWSEPEKGVVTYRDVLELYVQFSKRVVVVGSPTLLMDTGFIDYNATYAGGSGSDTLSFLWTVPRCAYCREDYNYTRDWVFRCKAKPVQYQDKWALKIDAGAGESIKERATVPYTDADLLLPRPEGNASLSKNLTQESVLAPEDSGG